MTGALAHRGPDGDGIHSWAQATFAHRRLAIFDPTEAGRQPMVDEQHNVGVTFNGAIYNFRSLRTELERSGHAFRSNTDTEVLINGYLTWGIDALVSRLRGMFAFGLWDDRTSTLYLVRDRLGVKPLLYVERPGAFAFASTARALVEGGFCSELDRNAVAEYLEFGYVPDDRVIYASAAKVPAGTILRWHNGHLQANRYWALPDISEGKSLSFDDAVEQTEHILLEAVRLRLAADVPVACLLSAGVDSALVSWAVAKHGANITAYTVGLGSDRADEATEAREIANQLGIKHETIPMRPETGPDITDLIAAYSEPFACASAMGLLLVSQAVKSSATVVLTGDGGDDAFLGYPEHRHLWLAQRTANVIPYPFTRTWNFMHRRIPRWGVLRRPAHFIDYAAGGLGAVVCAHDGIQKYEEQDVLGPRLQGCRIGRRKLQWSPQAGRNVLSAYLSYDRETRFVGEFLTKVDGATMWHGLEARSPFLDQELWTFAATLPFSTRLYGGSLKAVLRRIALRRIGPQVATGPKRGFTIPVERWLASVWRSSADDLFHSALLYQEGWIDRSRLLEWWSRVRTADRVPVQFWYLFVLENWLRQARNRRESIPLPTGVAVRSSKCQSKLFRSTHPGTPATPQEPAHPPQITNR